MSLHQYRRKRRLGGGNGQTPEPDDQPAPGDPKRRPIFVIQLHHASSRHFDFRLEMDGVLKSWAVPKGPSLRVGEKRLAVEVEDHPLSYAGFQGDIPEGHYGAGHVEVFDHGTWACAGDPLQALAAGKIDFVLHGQRLAGGWKLVRTAMKGRQVQWLLIKREDSEARDAEADDLLHAPLREHPGSAKKMTDRKRRKAESRWHARALKLQGARDRPYPRAFKPQLTDHRDAAPDGDRWLHEIKWDGYRLLADLHGGEVKLRSRNGLDWTGDFPEVVQAVQALPVDDARLDGELVVLDEKGRSDFAALQRVIDGSSKAPLRYLLFDLPGVAGVDISAAPLLERKTLLKALIGDTPGTLAFSDHVLGHGPQVFAASGKAGYEGIVSKQVDAPYVNVRARSWVKVKHEDTDEFLIVGHTAPKGSRVGFGSLLLATPDKDGLRYVGRVGTGFDDDSLRALARTLKPLAVEDAAVALPAHVPFRAASVHWVKPVRVAEVAFRGWGKEGLLRQASFKRLRSDKSGEDLAMPAKTTSSDDAVAISHPERVVFAKKKIRKGDVADYYRQMARWILPGIVGRPLSLLRCPDGAGKACFFQKHHGPGLGDAVHAVPLQQKSGREDYVYIDDVRGLLQLVQMNTLELHPWGATVADPEHPDRLVFDLDPGEGVGWNEVKAGARDVRDRLQEIGLRSFVRLSGGKGVHVVVPLQPAADWEQAKAFCEAFAQAMAQQAPERYVATMSKAKRGGVIFIDWLRNTRGATSVCSWSLRARESAGVAVPLRWEELARIKAADAFPLDKALARAKRLKADPWQGIDAVKQTLPSLDL
ncbi:DNA ligase D [Stenotrophomonas maltophilia]|uniref:DNA ligase D n=1 Tax=Stenotrophomonas maltophilia TaxID=40324 RepID=UPI000DA812F7|nr:DNA ligase D [Stenotrophomonas maltophilia]PZT27188.1 DNA ligase D [Stenotrophomonas maltophilia]HDS1217867.1 DNA ligase D [Stenotrophomonas maltophilia]HDS1232394.1 DNA ligase D [Stenotrophomonas maltophilia]